MKKIILFLIFLSIGISIYSANIKYITKTKEFLIYNRRNSNVYSYFVLRSGEQLKCKTINVDTLEVISRIIYADNNLSSYKYKININNEEKLIEKNIKFSEVSRGVNGENISSFNKMKKELHAEINTITIENVSKIDILIKLVGNNIVKSNKEIDYIRFTPNFYDKSKTLKINDKEFTYYTSKAGKIRLTLQGPIYLKIVSRMLFNNNIEKSMNYRYSILNNREFLAEFTEKAYKSNSGWFENDPEVIPSTGDVNIIKLPEGIHHIEIEDKDINRDLIFRFYINKAAVEIAKQ